MNAWEVVLSSDHPSLNRPYEDYRGSVDFVKLDGSWASFDPSESNGLTASGDENVWYGREVAQREHEILYRITNGRWVLVFVIPPGHENDQGPHPVNRELTPAQAALWLRLNKLAPPAGLMAASLIDVERRLTKTRLDRDWCPAAHPAGVESRMPSEITPKGKREKSTRKRDRSQSAKVIAYVVALIESREDAAKSGLPPVPLPSQKEIAEHLGVSEATVSRAGGPLLNRYLESNRPKMPRGWKNKKDGAMEARE